MKTYPIWPLFEWYGGSGEGRRAPKHYTEASQRTHRAPTELTYLPTHLVTGFLNYLLDQCLIHSVFAFTLFSIGRVWTDASIWSCLGAFVPIPGWASASAAMLETMGSPQLWDYIQLLVCRISQESTNNIDNSTSIHHHSRRRHLGTSASRALVVD